MDARRSKLEDVSTQAFKDLIHQAATCGIDNIGWSGGEPLLRPDIAELTAEASSLGIRVGLATNGYRATPTRLKVLKDAGLCVIQVSLDAPDKKRATRYRRGPKQHFSRAISAVRTSVELGFQTYVCTLLAPETMAETAEMIAFASSLGAHGLRYTMWAPVGRATGQRYDEARWRGSHLRHFLEAVRPHMSRASTFRVLVDCPTGPLPWSRRYVCGAGRETAYVTVSGDLYPCTALLFEEYRVGNVFERPFDQLFNEARMFKVLRELARYPAGEPCAGCRLIDMCRGGCPGRSFAAHDRLRVGKHRQAMPVCLFSIGHQL